MQNGLATCYIARAHVPLEKATTTQALSSTLKPSILLADPRIEQDSHRMSQLRSVLLLYFAACFDLPYIQHLAILQHVHLIVEIHGGTDVIGDDFDLVPNLHCLG